MLMFAFIIFIAFWIVSMLIGYLMLAQLSLDWGVLLVIDAVGSWIAAFLLTMVFDNKRYKIYPGGIATRVVGSEGVEGYLFLAPHGLLFHPHVFRVQKEDTRVPYRSIAEVREGNSSHSIEVETNEGVVERFAVKDQEKWIADIKGKMKGGDEEADNQK